MHTVGALDPTHGGTRDVVRQIGVALAGMPAHRIFIPGADVLGRAAHLSGIPCRLQGDQKDARLRACRTVFCFFRRRSSDSLP